MKFYQNPSAGGRVVRWKRRHRQTEITKLTVAFRKCTNMPKTLLSMQYMFLFPLQISAKIFFILRKIERDMIINVHRSSCKVPVILLRFVIRLEFLDRFSKNTQVTNFMKILLQETSCSMRTDMTKLIVAFVTLRTRLKQIRTNLSRQPTWTRGTTAPPHSVAALEAGMLLWPDTVV